MNKLPSFLKFNYYHVPNEIYVVGCGGTGAYIVSHLTRLISTIENKPNLTLVDNDLVELKNLKRQHFISNDIGKNKALALAERYSNAFGIEINVIQNEIKDGKQLQDAGRNVLLIGCVDNNASRKVFYDWFIKKAYNTKFWIDCGNEERSGQVICGVNNSRNLTYNLPRLGSETWDGIVDLPCCAEVYPEILNSDSQFNSDLSCADRAISAPQNMQTNVTAATIALNYIQKIILGQPLTSFGVEFSIDNCFRTLYNTVDNFKCLKRNY